jgi:3-oxoacyl-[acyl-carrier-protein] synthase II
MADAPRDVLITGIGIISCLGEGLEAHWRGLNEPSPTADTKTFAPNVVHALGRVDFDKQIPKKGDQRQMEAWQRIGTYAAGLALDSAGAKGNAELLGRMDMIVAAGGGERDWVADAAILSGLPKADNPDRFLNERLMSDLRPTLFLAQLSNLLAGNISIVHGVTGSSRTFMGEELAGVDATRIASARIKAGPSDIALVGGAQNGERKDLLMLYEFGGYCLKEEFHTVWDRRAAPGFALASLGAFVVLESRQHAQRRQASPLAKLSAVTVRSGTRHPGSIEASLERMWTELGIPDAGTAVISGAPGTEPAAAEERAFLARHPDVAVRATGSHFGHSVESQFTMNIAVAALALNYGKLFPPFDATGVERPMTGGLGRAVVTGVSHWRGEGLALVEPV